MVAEDVLIREQDEAAAPRTGEGASREPVRHSSRRKKSRRYRELEKKARYLKTAVWILGGICVLGGLVLGFLVNGMQTKIQALTEASTREKVKRVQIEAETKRLRASNNQLVLGRIPNLRPLEFGRIIPDIARFVDNILFTITSVGKTKQYEYMAVVRNGTEFPVMVKVEIFLFDSFGIQVGKADVVSTDSPYKKRQAVFQPGESRSYSAKLELSSGKPEYFLVKTMGVSLGKKTSEP